MLLGFIKSLLGGMFSVVKYLFNRGANSIKYLYSQVDNDFKREKMIRKIKEQRRKQFRLNDEI